MCSGRLFTISLRAFIESLNTIHVVFGLMIVFPTFSHHNKHFATIVIILNQVLPLVTITCNCHESGCHSLQLHITHGLHLPSCTAHTHSHPPLHQSHSCHHSLINPDCLTTPAPHSLTHIKAAHKHSPSAKSCFSPG